MVTAASNAISITATMRTPPTERQYSSVSMWWSDTGRIAAKLMSVPINAADGR